jgi:hypothetical protein
MHDDTGTEIEFVNDDDREKHHLRTQLARELARIRVLEQENDRLRRELADRNQRIEARNAGRVVM